MSIEAFGTLFLLFGMKSKKAQNIKPINSIRTIYLQECRDSAV